MNVVNVLCNIQGIVIQVVYGGYEVNIKLASTLKQCIKLSTFFRLVRYNRLAWTQKN